MSLDEPADLKPGRRVKLHDLKGAPELNGQIGHLRDFHADRGRWAVALPGSAAPKLLKAENLEMLPADSSDCANVGTSDSAARGTASTEQAATAQKIPKIPEAPAGSIVTTATAMSSAGPSAMKLSDGLCFYINLDRRTDRKKAMEALAAPHNWLKTALTRIPAVDGKKLKWNDLVRDGLITTQACMEAKFAEQQQQATMNLESPEEGPSHLTLGGCGCALSHKKTWQKLVDSEAKWALILEDDLKSVCSNFDAELETIIGRLPKGWHVCYLGHHTPQQLDKMVLQPGQKTQGPFHMAEEGGWLPGLYCYMLSKAGAKFMLQKAVPFPEQVDSVFGALAVESGGCYVVPPGQFLAYSPPTEVSRDTDIQTFPDDM